MLGHSKFLFWWPCWSVLKMAGSGYWHGILLFLPKTTTIIWTFFLNPIYLFHRDKPTMRSWINILTCLISHIIYRDKYWALPLNVFSQVKLQNLHVNFCLALYAGAPIRTRLVWWFPFSSTSIVFCLFSLLQPKQHLQPSHFCFHFEPFDLF